ncbi:2-oxoglutarate and oxygenase superfamily protein [Perilla frutescens var. hirtella]|uniref:2-oxoglutarate and oxygenase superfamily protein n=1 Tax=Perilla frutescens var. hirtella TaxID=608512 RepID=A0AAD4JQ30_PERFH|nr:2-oxoglutarate and oxygenase superfamily protein [Perilla frutescens var. hirtella]KAH6817914.1 2-oxoglutarate and oxygenase superfamily protein [Perilla frutescens var. frutescens]KAH6837976.1 2-oxoglutarate and oxygenase superfamily protein [Perilla frutescens var. hirtella]
MIYESENPLQLPILDVSEPLNSSSLASLATACREWGFFQIINHGISKDLYTKIYSLSDKIFCLPSESKLKLGPFSSLKTYTPHFIASPFFESIRVSGPDFAASAQNSADVLGHQDHDFSEILQEYGSKVTELSKTILNFVLMTLGDGFESKYYDSEFNNCHGYMRINNYTPPQNSDEEAEGLGMHTDMSCLTIVYQDEIGGLQVRSRDGKWMNIIPCEGTLVVNIGDMLQAWSNERLRSSEHRVVLKKPINRFSLAFFWCFEDDKVVSAPDDVVGQQHARIYNPFVCLDYLKFRESNEKGRFEKVGFTVKDFAGAVEVPMVKTENGT